MSYPRFRLAATVLLIGSSMTALAATYDINPRDGTDIDAISADGYCSLAEAVNAINLQRGTVALESILSDLYWDFSVTDLVTKDVDGGVLTYTTGSNTGTLNIARTVRNVTQDTSDVTLGGSLSVVDGDVVEYTITLSASTADAMSPTVTLHSLPSFSELGYSVAYVPQSAKLNSKDLALADFPLGSPLSVYDETASSATPYVSADNQAVLKFQVKVSGITDDETRVYGVECVSGDASNTLRFPTVAKDSEDDAPEYQLNDTLEIGLDDQSVSVSVQYLPEDSFDTDATLKKNFVLHSPEGQRIFHTGANSTLTLAGVTLRGDAEYDEVSEVWSCPQRVTADGGHGGLIRTAGHLNTDSSVRLIGGCAAGDGGAIYVEDKQRTLTLSYVMFERNSALGNGGAIATSGTVYTPVVCSYPLEPGDDNYDPDAYCNDSTATQPADQESSFSGSVVLERFHFLGNGANGKGGAIYLDGVGSTMTAVSGTFYNNFATTDGGAIHVANSSNRTLMFNNVTVAGNSTGGNGGGLYLAPWDPLDDDNSTTDIIANTVILGNTPYDCESDTDTLEAATIVYSASGPSLADASVQSCGPHEEGYSHDENLFDPADATSAVLPFDWSHLKGREAVCANAGCKPFGGEDDPDTDNGELIYFLPTLDMSGPGGSKVWPSLVAAASPEESTDDYVCSDTDIRDKERISRCDIGATQLLIAQGEIDEFNAVQGVETSVDVLKNDLGDLDVDCSLIPSGEDCMWFPKLPDYGFVRFVVGDGVELDSDGNVIPNGYPMAFYQSLPTKHGVDIFRYAVHRDAIVGETTNSYGPSAQVNMVVEPASGMTEPRDIDDIDGLGGWGLWSLLLSALLSVRRLKRAPLYFLALLLPLGAGAAEIRVTTTLESETGRCSLSQAIEVSLDGTPAWYPSCGSGATGTDQIILPEGEYVISTMLQVSPGNKIEIIGDGPGKTIIRGDGTTRLFDLRSAVTFANLTLAEGNTSEAGQHGAAILTNSSLSLINVELRDNSSAGNGGAIHLNYLGGLSGGTARELSITNSYVHGNSAAGAGAVASMTGQTSGHKVYLENSTFENNSSASSVFALSMFRGGLFSSINNTWFNHSVPLFDLANMHADVSAYVLNNTFKGKAPLFNYPGGTDPKVYISHSVLADVTACASGGTATGLYYNIFEPAAAAGCGVDATDGNQVLSLTQYQDAFDGFTALSGEVAYDADADTYIPPHFPVVPSAAATDYILDKGDSTTTQASSTSSPQACRDTDLRAVSRASGSACDIGAYELNVPTAQDDSAANTYQRSREVRFDVLLNDTVGDGVTDNSDPANPVVHENSAKSETLAFADLDEDGDPSGSFDIPPPAGLPVRLSSSDGDEIADGTLTLVPNGVWTYDHSGVTLKEGSHNVQAVIYNDLDEAVASAYQYFVVRASGEKESGDVFTTSAASMLRIADIGYGEGEFVSPDGQITASGYSDLPAGWKIEVYVDGVKQGETTLERGTSCDGTETACIVQLSDVEIDMGAIAYDPDRECEWLNAGLVLKKAYRYDVDNNGSTLADPATYATFTATVSNLAPTLVAQTEQSSAGKTVIFQLEASDIDGTDILRSLKAGTEDTENRPISPVTLTTAPKFAATRKEIVGGRNEWLSFGLIDDSGVALGPVLADGSLLYDGDPASVEGLGLVLNLQDNTITYRPANVQQEFNDTFSLTVEDDCGLTASADFTVEYPNQGKTQGLAGGWLLWLLLPLGLARRWRAGRCRSF